MKKTLFHFKVTIVILLIASGLSAQDKITVRFKESDEVLVNPGIGFTTFQRFNGDRTNDGVFVPRDMPAGVYQIQVGIIDIQSHKPKVNLAITGRDPEGWYPLGRIEIR